MAEDPSLGGSVRPEPPILMLARQAPYLYAEATVERATRHLAGHVESSDSFRSATRDYDYFDGEFRAVRLVVTGYSSVTLELAGTAPQPVRVRARLRQVLGWVEQALIGHDLLAAADTARLAAGRLLPERELAAARQALTAAAQAVSAAEQLPGTLRPVLLPDDAAPSLRKALEDLDPVNEDLGKLVNTLAERFGAPPEIEIQHRGGFLHNALHAAGWTHG